MKLVRGPKAIRLDIERTRQALENDIREQATGTQVNSEPIWNKMNLLFVYYIELNDLVGDVLDLELPKQKDGDMILLISESNQDGEIVTEQAYNERLALMSPFDRATHTAIPVAPEVASDVDRELNTLKRGFNKINGLAKKRA